MGLYNNYPRGVIGVSAEVDNGYLVTGNPYQSNPNGWKHGAFYRMERSQQLRLPTGKRYYSIR